MDVLVTGAGGFIGSALLPALTAAGHRPIRAIRGTAVPQGVDGIAWDPDAGTIDHAALEGIGAVVHLAGAGIGDRRWTDARKQVILESRTRGTSLIASALASAQKKPSVLVSASAIGYYGDRGDEVLTEESASGDDFLADICRQWEAAAAPVAAAGIRLVTIRTGIVLGRDGGVLKQLLLPFRLGLGGRVASGKQWMSWIALADEVGAILYALHTESLSGAVNLTAPNPVTNAELTRAIAQAVHMPALFPVPSAVLRLAFGQMADEALLASQRARPRRLLELGMDFAFPTVERALATTR